jgi:hypothetical protein
MTNKYKNIHVCMNDQIDSTNKTGLFNTNSFCVLQYKFYLAETSFINFILKITDVV